MAPVFDVLLSGMPIVDGSGAPRRTADVGIQRDRILAVGDLSDATAEFSLEIPGCVVCPGFIDMHTHSDLTPLIDFRCASKVRQGVTTELVGHCGFSAFPLNHRTDHARQEMERSIFLGSEADADWTDCAGYLEALERAKPAINIATLAGNGTIRSAVMGYDNRPPTPDELRSMRKEVARAMEQGAFGLSSGLTLYPSSAAGTDEVAVLCAEAAAYGGIYDTHTRHLAGWHYRSVEEAIEIGRRANLPVQVAHLCLIDPRYWNHAETLLKIIETARAGDLDVTYDAYPYAAAGCPFTESMPDWVMDGGWNAMIARLNDPATRNKVLSEAEQTWFAGIPVDWDKVIIAWPGPKGDPGWSGRSVSSLGQDSSLSPPAMIIEILLQSGADGTMIVHNRVESDIKRFLAHPLGMIGSDGRAVAPDGRWGKSPVHPRFYGTFPRVLARYTREFGIMSLEEAIRKMTSLPAGRLGLKDRGRIQAGCIADLVLFNPSTVQDRATFEDSHQFPSGIEYVMVNGKWVVAGGEQTGARPGRVLRRP